MASPLLTVGLLYHCRHWARALAEFLGGCYAALGGASYSLQVLLFQLPTRATRLGDYTSFVCSLNSVLRRYVCFRFAIYTAAMGEFLLGCAQQTISKSDFHVRFETPARMASRP